MPQRTTAVDELSELAQETERLAQHVEEMRLRIAARRRQRELAREGATQESSMIPTPPSPRVRHTPEPRPAVRPGESGAFLPDLPALAPPANDRASNNRASNSGVRPAARDAGRYTVVLNQGDSRKSEERLCIPGSPRAKVTG